MLGDMLTGTAFSRPQILLEYLQTVPLRNLFYNFVAVARARHPHGYVACLMLMTLPNTAITH